MVTLVVAMRKALIPTVFHQTCSRKREAWHPKSKSSWFLGLYRDDNQDNEYNKNAILPRLENDAFCILTNHESQTSLTVARNSSRPGPNGWFGFIPVKSSQS